MSQLPDLPDFDVRARLAVGGMAEIYRAVGRAGELAGREVVLKRLLPILRGEAAYVELFLAEARLGALVVHPNIVRTYDVFRRGRDFFIVQELVGGDTLGSLVRQAHARRSRISIEAGLVCIADLLGALGHLHAGAPGPHLAPGAHLTPIIHRDVNPENIVAGPDGVAKLIDFGIAEAQGASQTRERSGALRGTPAYMSPEQVKSRPLEPASDLFSAGAVLWEVLANRPLFAQANEFETLRHVCEVPAPPLRLIDAALPASLERLCVRALARERDRRFQSAGEFLAELRDAAHREGYALERSALASEVVRLAPAAPRVSDSQPPRR